MREPIPTTPSTTATTLHPPRQLRFLVIGAGSRGTAYAEAVTNSISPSSAVIHAVADPHAFKREQFGKAFIWGESGKPREGQVFGDWKEWVDWEVCRRHENENADSRSLRKKGVDGVFICTLDETHVEIIQAIAPLQVHILCEKPLALSLDDCLRVYRSLRPPSTGNPRIFSIGHVLRYSPHNILLRDLVLSRDVIGDIVSLEHCEPVGWWHFSHSYVRGNWRRATDKGDGSLLTKSCHDIDFIMWLLCSPLSPSSPSSSSSSSSSTSRHIKPHLPRSITSTGSLTQFRQKRKPPKAGSATTNCLSCPAEEECMYSAIKIYRDMHLSKENHRSHLGWPVDIVCPDIEDTFHLHGLKGAEDRLMDALAEDYGKRTATEGGGMSDEQIRARPWYGRCVFEADNDVCDDQVVTIKWDDEDEEVDYDSNNNNNNNKETARPRPSKTAIFHMISPTEKQCERRGRIYGTSGELTYDSHSISIHNFKTQSTTIIDVPKQPPEEAKSHGGGDYGLARSYVGAVDAVENRGWGVDEAQDCFVGCTLEEAVRSHAVVFAAEEARREEKVVKWREWWREKLDALGLLHLHAMA